MKLIEKMYVYDKQEQSTPAITDEGNVMAVKLLTSLQ